MGNVVLGAALALIAVAMGFVMGYGVSTSKKDADK